MPNGRDMRGYDEDIEVLERLYAPRTLLERRPTQPVLRGIGIGLLFSTFIVGLLFLLVERGC